MMYVGKDFRSLIILLMFINLIIIVVTGGFLRVIGGNLGRLGTFDALTFFNKHNCLVTLTPKI